ncbi:MAG TPA: NAD(P) transhydrogenase subunit alpha [Blastocatellia bacterium]|nr:NAD(P) transhydrogenase subunit alpha [Blastocatellia bacterium]
MKISILRDSQPAESRVALVPESVRSLKNEGDVVQVQSGAGAAAGASDDDFAAAGATVLPNRDELLSTCDVLAVVNRPSTPDIELLQPNTVVVGFLKPLDEPDEMVPFLERGVTTIAMELIPRITRAQAMDALSSMATVAGYKAVLMAADLLPRMFPMLITAAGTVAPAKVLVLGAGVAGLQAIATARRLGAVVEAYDVRATAGEHVRSLGANFLQVDLGGIKTEDEGGYAVELSEEALERGRQLIAERARAADVIVTSAQVPGRPAPILLRTSAVDRMKPGSIVVDLAAPTGGNCELSKPGETIAHRGVTIMAPLNVAASVPVHASQLYSRNVAALLRLLRGADGEVRVDLADDVVAPACITHGGQIVNQRVAVALEAFEI